MTKHTARIILFAAIVASMALVASAQKSSGAATVNFLGNIENHVYKNSFFGLQMSIPQSWIVVDQETTAATSKVGLDMFKSKNEKNNRALQDSVNNEVALLNVAKKPIGSLGNAVFMMATRKQPSAAVTPSMLAEATKSALATSPGLKLTQGLRLRTIAGKQFALLDYTVTANGQTASIKFFATMVRNYSLTFSLSCADEADLPELQKIVESMKFSAR